MAYERLNQAKLRLQKLEFDEATRRQREQHIASVSRGATGAERATQSRMAVAGAELAKAERLEGLRSRLANRGAPAALLSLIGDTVGRSIERSRQSTPANLERYGRMERNVLIQQKR